MAKTKGRFKLPVGVFLVFLRFLNSNFKGGNEEAGSRNVDKRKETEAESRDAEREEWVQTIISGAAAGRPGAQRRGKRAYIHIQSNCAAGDFGVWFLAP